MSFQKALDTIDRRSNEQARKLQFGRAALHLFIFPFYAVAWFAGRLVWGVRYTLGVLKVGFMEGAKIESG